VTRLKTGQLLTRARETLDELDMLLDALGDHEEVALVGDDLFVCGGMTRDLAERFKAMRAKLLPKKVR
jgi:hypothetical protein